MQEVVGIRLHLVPTLRLFQALPPEASLYDANDQISVANDPGVKMAE